MTQPSIGASNIRAVCGVLSLRLSIPTHLQVPRAIYLRPHMYVHQIPTSIPHMLMCVDCV